MTASERSNVKTTSSLWRNLYDRDIFFTLRGLPVPLFGQSLDSTRSEGLLESRDITLGQALLFVEMIDAAWFPYGAIIDLELLRELHARRAEGLASTKGFRALAEMARIRLQGTDGLRGRARSIELGYREALSLFLKEGVVTPSFLGLSAKALALECREQGLLGSGEEVVVGSDGRDRSGLFARAVARGFNEGGLAVIDAGILPTPGIPLFAHARGCSIGAIITASHNPSNQNGIKFVYRGFKLANDGPAGECGLTARMYRLADADETSSARRSVLDLHRDAEELLYRVDMANAGLRPEHLESLSLVYDGANGAYSSLACRVLNDLGAHFTPVNVDPRGENINQGGGVGEIEGHLFFERGEGAVNNLASLRAMFHEGQKAKKDRRVFGIVNDGDGDRGYLLAYSPAEDRVYVVAGDEVAFWLARGRKEEGSLGDFPVCVNSVESDILAGYSMETLLGVKSETACVGDKNLLKPAKEGKNHIVGCEESGHVTFGVPVPDREGRPGMVYTGNGLLSVLKAISVMEECGADIPEIVHPFPPGKKDGRFVYFVDKSRFYQGSPAWKEAESAALGVLEGRLPPGFAIRRVEFADDPHMLYLACIGPGGRKEGALFVRNSGTETKMSVTLRCTEELYPLFREAMLAVHRSNLALMKDHSSKDARLETMILERLGRGSVTMGDLKIDLENSSGAGLALSDLNAILFALRKEGLVTVEDGTIREAGKE